MLCTVETFTVDIQKLKILDVDSTSNTVRNNEDREQTISNKKWFFSEHEETSEKKKLA